MQGTPEWILFILSPVAIRQSSSAWVPCAAAELVDALNSRRCRHAFAAEIGL